MNTQRGGCLCGSVRYQFQSSEGPPSVIVCHCRHCQRQSGSLFSVNIKTDATRFQVEGTTRVYQDTGESGKPVLRHFCGQCGSALYTVAESLPNAVIVKAGTLDTPPATSPTVELFTEYAAAWWPVLEGVQRLARARPS